MRDKEELETAYEALQEEMEELLREGTGGEGRQNELTSNKDTRTLKKIIKNMEVSQSNSSTLEWHIHMHTVGGHVEGKDKVPEKPCEEN